jgi:Putative Ig domain
VNWTHPRMRTLRHGALITLLASIAACGGQDGASDVAAATPAAHLAISGKPPATITAGSEYTFTPTVSPAEAGRTLTFSITNKPSWASFNGRSGNLAGSPASPGTFSAILIGVTDGKNSTSLPPFTVTVAPDPKKASATGAAGAAADVVKISGTPPHSVTAGKPYSFKPTASDTAGRTLSYSVRNKPAWAAFSIATGLLAGTPASTQTGTYPGIVISASDGTASAALPAFSISVNTAAAAPTTLSQKHPGDVGIGSDPEVVFYENFEEGSVAAAMKRYSSKHVAGMSLVADHPADSPGGHALQLTAGGSHDTADFYKSFGAGYDELYLRYYIKYLGSGPWHHSGVWFGGYNPPLPWPYPHAGSRPTGDDRYSIGFEPITTFSHVPLDFYVYWRGMHSWKADPTGAVGDYWGNTFLHDAQLLTESGDWECYELHLKLNPNPANGIGAVLELWKNNALVRRFDDSTPLGYWVRDKFCPIDADGSECTRYRPANPKLVVLDQRWRTTTALKINYLWPMNYNTASGESSLRLDDMVIAKQRIGCTVRK